KIEPQTVTLPLIPEQATRQEFTATNEKSLFPLPTAHFAYTIGKQGDDEHEEGEPENAGQNNKKGIVEEVDVKLVMPSYKTVTAKRMKAAPTIDGVLSEQELAGL